MRGSFHKLAFFGCALWVVSCANGLQGPALNDGGRGGEDLQAISLPATTLQNNAAPMQYGGTITPDYDHQEGCVNFAVNLEAGYDTVVKDGNGQDAIRLKGTLLNNGKLHKQAKFLKIIDWPSHSYVVTPLEAGESQEHNGYTVYLSYSFDLLFHIPPINPILLEGSPQNKILTFLVSFKPSFAENVGLTQSCEDKACVWNDEWHCIKETPGQPSTEGPSEPSKGATTSSPPADPSPATNGSSSGVLRIPGKK